MIICTICHQPTIHASAICDRCQAAVDGATKLAGSPEGRAILFNLIDREMSWGAEGVGKLQLNDVGERTLNVQVGTTHITRELNTFLAPYDGLTVQVQVMLNIKTLVTRPLQ